MEPRSPGGRSVIAKLTAKLTADAQNDEDADQLLRFADILDGWVQEDLLSRLGRRADPEGAADAAFRAWRKLPDKMRAVVAKAAEEESCAEQLQALVGNLAERSEE